MKTIKTFDEFVNENYNLNESKMSKEVSDFYSWAAMIAHGKYGGIEMSMDFGQDKISTIQEVIDLLSKFVYPKDKKAFLKDIDGYLKKNNITNESYNLNENFKWDKKKRKILMGKKEIDPSEIGIESFVKGEMWLDVEVQGITDQNGKKLNKKEKEDLVDWVTGADGFDAQYDWHDMFGGRL